VVTPSWSKRVAPPDVVAAVATDTRRVAVVVVWLCFVVVCLLFVCLVVCCVLCVVCCLLFVLCVVCVVDDWLVVCAGVI